MGSRQLQPPDWGMSKAEAPSTRKGPEMLSLLTDVCNGDPGKHGDLEGLSESWRRDE